MNERKPRAIHVRVDFGKEQTLTGMQVAEDGKLSFFDENGAVVDPVRADVGKSYSRSTKSPKVLNRSAVRPFDIQTDPNRSLLKYSLLAAVDTNTDDINGIRVSIAVSVLIRNITIDTTRWSANLVPQTAFEFHSASASPERIGWREFLEALVAHSGVGGPIGLIVDSELDALETINARRQPVVNNFFLPENCELIYASGERGTTEFIANAAIADCDRTASRLLNRLRTEGFQGAYLFSPSRPHGHFRYWDPPTGTPQQ